MGWPDLLTGDVETETVPAEGGYFTETALPLIAEYLDRAIERASKSAGNLGDRVS
jgi:hypothetical protein